MRKTWEDNESEGRVVRLFFQTDINTFFAGLCHTGDFKTLVGNSTVLDMTGRSAETEAYRAEAINFPA